jgi:hypothetical protein
MKNNSLKNFDIFKKPILLERQKFVIIFIIITISSSSSSIR